MPGTFALDDLSRGRYELEAVTASGDHARSAALEVELGAELEVRLARGGSEAPPRG